MKASAWLWRIVVAWMLASAGYCAAAGTTPLVTLAAASVAGEHLAPYTAYLVDGSGGLTLQEVRAAELAGKFISSGQPILRAGDGHPTWFVLRFKQADFNGDWVITLPFANVPEVRFYGPLDTDGLELSAPVLTGGMQPFGSRPLKSETYSFRMQLEVPGEYAVYFRIVSEIPRSYEFKLWDLASYHLSGQDKRIFDGLCYGVIIGMLLYNLVLFLVFRDRTYGLYLASGFVALVSIVVFNGHMARYILPDVPLLTYRMTTTMAALWILFGGWFAHSFLSLEKFAPAIGRLVQLTMVLAGFTALAGALGYTTLAQAANESVSLAGTVVVAMGAIASWRKGFLPARLYLLGQCALFASVVVQVMHNWGVLDWPFMYENGLQAGLAIEVMVFAVALSSRIRTLHAVNAELTSKAEKLIVASETDPLTGVANRAGLASKARELLVNSRRRTVMLIDLDKFKPINDLHGHAAGDAMLVEVGKRLKGQLRPSDVVARIGGDEFVVVLGEPNDRPTVELISKRLLNAIVEPLLFGGASLAVGGSLGIARYPEDGNSIEDLLQAADVAMYHIKKNGRANFAFFDDLNDLEAQMAAQIAAKSAPQKDDEILF